MYLKKWELWEQIKIKAYKYHKNEVLQNKKGLIV